MKKSWSITILACLIILGCGGLIIGWPRTVPFDQCSEVYKKYADINGIDASFIKDYKINDSVSVAVTLLQANDSAWLQLTDDFNAQLPPDMPSQPNTVDFWYAPHDNYSLPMDTVLTNNDIIAISHNSRTIAIFHIKTEKQINAVFYHKITTNKNTSKK